jgi:hypothetical protein
VKGSSRVFYEPEYMCADLNGGYYRQRQVKTAIRGLKWYEE